MSPVTRGGALLVGSSCREGFGDLGQLPPGCFSEVAAEEETWLLNSAVEASFLGEVRPQKFLIPETLGEK